MNWNRVEASAETVMRRTAMVVCFLLFAIFCGAIVLHTWRVLIR